MSYLRRDLIAKGYPRLIAIEPTNACAMKCKICPRQYMKRKVGFMKLDLFKKIIDQAQGYTTYVSLELFGDGLLHPNIDKMIKYLHSYNIIVQISTNPTSLTDDVIKKILRTELDILLLSLDGIGWPSYKENRGDNADYDQAVKNILSLLEQRKGKKPYIDIRMIDLPNLDFKIFHEQWCKSGVDQVSLGPFHTFGGVIEGSSTKLNEDICYKPWQGLHVLWDGRVVPCCFDYDGEVILGDLNKQSLAEVWNGEPMKKLRRQCINKNFTYPLCKQCPEKRQIDQWPTHFVHYNYQRNQHLPIVKMMRKIVK